MKIEHGQHLGLPYSSLRVTDLCYVIIKYRSYWTQCRLSCDRHNDF